MEGYWGPLIRTVSSLDGSIELQPTNPATYTSMSKTTSFRYNTQKYYWYLNGYLYMPNIDWDAIKLEGVFEGIYLNGHVKQMMIVFQGISSK
ncbi:MAG: hypothetical protein CM15mV42_0490 [uncultured marine virus]|nr:MAG: hypothetical protein CM15mV42_0490 [uncultured marine virus]